MDAAVTTAELAAVPELPLLDDVRIAALTLPDAQPADWRLTALPGGLHLLELDGAGVPVEIRLSVPLGDAAGYWHPKGGWRRTLPADWEGRSRVSLVDATAVGCLYEYSGATMLAFAAADPVPEAELRFGVSEENDTFVVHLRLPATLGPQRLLFAPRHPSVAAALRALRGWYAAHTDAMPVPEGARTPVYSTWYAFNQDVAAGPVETQAALAAGLGCGALILDDGWQRGGHGRGYAGCGDWLPDPAKFPDLGAHVARVRGLGMRYLLWVAPLLLGTGADCFDRWSPYAPAPARAPGAQVLDPRRPEVRRHVVDLCTGLVRDHGLDGLKLDFLDEAMAYAGAAEPGLPDVGEAMVLLLTELRRALEQLRPGGDLLLELRQPYVGPGMAAFGNLLRSFDCPADATANRVQTIDAALLAVGGAVHSDMLLWSADAPVHSAARQLIGALHAVPQVSVRLDALPADHLAAVGFWLERWRQLRPQLLDGTVEPGRPDELYPVVRCEAGGSAVISVHGEHTVPVDLARLRELTLLNGSAADRIVLDLTGPAATVELTVHGPTGRIIERSRRILGPGLHAVPVPRSGLAALLNTEGTA